MDNKAARNAWSRFSATRIQRMCAWNTAIWDSLGFTIALGQWCRAWLPQHWWSDNMESRQQANHSTKQHRQIQIRPAYFWQQTMLVFLALSLLFKTSVAAFIDFENCLAPSVINNPLQLQFTPLYVYASFNTTAESHNLNVTVYGNISGFALAGNPPPATLPAWNDTQYWANTSETAGKIMDVSPVNNLASTLFVSFNVLSYTPYNSQAMRFANHTLQGQFPLVPVFTTDA